MTARPPYPAIALALRLRPGHVAPGGPRAVAEAADRLLPKLRHRPVAAAAVVDRAGRRHCPATLGVHQVRALGVRAPGGLAAVSGCLLAVAAVGVVAAACVREGAPGWALLIVAGAALLASDRSLVRGGPEVGRRPHKPEVAGSSPAPATTWSRAAARGHQHDFGAAPIRGGSRHQVGAARELPAGGPATSGAAIPRRAAPHFEEEG